MVIIKMLSLGKLSKELLCLILLSLISVSESLSNNQKDEYFLPFDSLMFGPSFSEPVEFWQGDTIFFSVDSFPEFYGNIESEIYEKFDSSLNVSGYHFSLRFVIDKQGFLRDLYIVEVFDYKRDFFLVWEGVPKAMKKRRLDILHKEFERILLNKRDWKPGVYKGENVCVESFVLIDFP